MNEDDLKRELERLYARLARIENHLRLGEIVEEPEEESPAASQPPAPVVRASSFTESRLEDQAEREDRAQERLELEPLAAMEAPPPAERPAEPAMREEEEEEADAAAKPAHPPIVPSRADVTVPPIVTPPPRPAAPPTVPPTAQPSAPPPAPQRIVDQPKERKSLEVLIGGKWMAWVGALIVIIGAGFLAAVLDLASWWGNLDAIIKCIILTAFGGALIAGAEIVLRKVGKAASVGLYAAGLGTWYVTAFATAGWYQLFSEPVAFLLLACVALIGFAFGLRTKFLTIGILSIVGGYLAPILMSNAKTFDAAMPLYLTMLLAIALGLSAFVGRPFRPLRYVALAGQTVLGAFWVLDAGSSAWAYFLVFGGGWWMMIVAEAVFAALREQSRVGNGVAVVHGTAAYVSVTNILLWSSVANAEMWSGLFTAGMSLLAAAVALHFGPGLEGLRATTKKAMDVLALILWIQAAILAPIALALQFDGFGHTFSWLVLGAGAIEAGRHLRARRVDGFGLVVLSMGLAKVTLWDWWAVTALRSTILTAGDITISGWAILALIAVAAVMFAAFRLRPSERSEGALIIPTIKGMLGAAAMGLWMIVCITQAEPLTATMGWLFAAVVLVALRRPGRSVSFFEFGRIVLLFTVVKWMTFDVLFERVTTSIAAIQSVAPFINGQMIVAVLIAIAAWWIYRVQEKEAAADTLDASDEEEVRSIGQRVFDLGSHPLRALVVLFPVIASIVILWGLSFEVERVVGTLDPGPWRVSHLRALWLTLLWAAGGAAMTLVGQWRTHRPLAYVGLVTLGCSAIVYLSLDTLAMRAADGLVADVSVILNPHCLIGFAVAVLLLGVMILLRGERIAIAGLRAWLPVAAGFIALWALSFEVERWLDSTRTAGAGPPAWSFAHHVVLYLTLLWSAGGLIMMLIGRVRGHAPLTASGVLFILVSAVAWLSIGTLVFRLTDGPGLTAVVMNPQFIIGAALGIMLMVMALLDRGRALTAVAGRLREGGTMPRVAPIAITLVALIGLWLGSLEIDRYFAPDWPDAAANARMARQTAWSIYWGVYGIMLIAAGFIRNIPLSRYAGIALLAITLVKVGLIDTSQLTGIYRPMSLIGLGLLLVATSIAYAKLSPKILALQARGDS